LESLLRWRSTITAVVMGCAQLSKWGTFFFTLRGGTFHSANRHTQKKPDPRSIKFDTQPHCLVLRWGTYANMTRPPPPDERPPFLSDCISPPPVHWQSFKQPSLCRCPFAPDTIKWCAMVGYGSQGCVFKVQFGNKGPFAVKIVRRQTPTASSATAS